MASRGLGPFSGDRVNESERYVGATQVCRAGPFEKPKWAKGAHLEDLGGAVADDGQPDGVQDVGGERPDRPRVRRRVLGQLLPHPRHRLGRRRVHLHRRGPALEGALHPQGPALQRGRRPAGGVPQDDREGGALPAGERQRRARVGSPRCWGRTRKALHSPGLRAALDARAPRPQTSLAEARTPAPRAAGCVLLAGFTPARRAGGPGIRC